jgi:hypothetical protein
VGDRHAGGVRVQAGRLAGAGRRWPVRTCMLRTCMMMTWKTAVMMITQMKTGDWKKFSTTLYSSVWQHVARASGRCHGHTIF